MKKISSILILLTLILQHINAQEINNTYTMGYTAIQLKVLSPSFLSVYTPVGKEPICGMYSPYNHTLYFAKNETPIKNVNPENIAPAKEKCFDNLTFDDGPKPYAMMQFLVDVKNINYETNTITGFTDGAEISITTTNAEIDAYYKKFHKIDALGSMRINFILKNWNYTPESEDSYLENIAPANKKIHYKSKRAKHEEQLLHKSEYDFKN